MASSAEAVLEIPGRWDAVPSLPGVMMEEQPRQPGLRERYERLADGRLGEADLDVLDRHALILRIHGGGSKASASALLQAGAALLASGGAAVHVETAALVHDKEAWLELARRASDDAVFYAFVGIGAAGPSVASRGMQAFGMRDARVLRAPGEMWGADRVLRSFLVYGLRSSADVADGDIFSSPPVTSPSTGSLRCRRRTPMGCGACRRPARCR